MNLRPRRYMLPFALGFSLVIGLQAAQPAARTNQELRINPEGMRAIDRTKLTEAIQIKPSAELLTIDTTKLRFMPTTQLVAVDLAGNRIETKSTSTAISVAAKAGQWVVLKPERTQTVEMTKGLQWLPGMCIVPEKGDARTYFTYVKFAIAPVVWDTAEDCYKIIADIGVASEADDTISGPLGKTATVKLALDGIPAEPAELTIDRLGIQGEREVSFRFHKTTKTTPRIIVRSNIAHEQDFAVPIQPRIFLSASDHTVLGFGLSETVVTARPVDAMGAELKGFAGRDLDPVLEGGVRTSSGPLQFDGASRASFTVRASVLGPVKITATTRTADHSLSGSLTIDTRLPWEPLVAALIGGMLGGFCRRFVKGARKDRTKHHLVEGAAVSIIAFVAGVLGVGAMGLPTEIVGTVAGAFLTGAISGFLGVVVLERIARKASPTAAR